MSLSLSFSFLAHSCLVRWLSLTLPLLCLIALASDSRSNHDFASWRLLPFDAQNSRLNSPTSRFSLFSSTSLLLHFAFHFFSSTASIDFSPVLDRPSNPSLTQLKLRFSFSHPLHFNLATISPFFLPYLAGRDLLLN